MTQTFSLKNRTFKSSLRYPYQEKDLLQNQIHREREIKADFERRFRENSAQTTHLQTRVQEMQAREERLRQKNQQMTSNFEQENRTKEDDFKNSEEKIREMEELIQQLSTEKSELREMYLEAKDQSAQLEINCDLIR